MITRLKEQMKKIIDFLKEEQKYIKPLFSALVTLCSVITAVASVIISKQALDISEISLKNSSKDAEPILDMDIDWSSDTIRVKNLSSDIYQINHVNFGLIRTIAIMDSSYQINSVELEDKLASMNLEHGHTEGTDCSDEDAEKYNKEFLLSLSDESKSNWGIIVNNQDEIDEIENVIRGLCDSSDEYEYWEVSYNFDYRFIEVYYTDVYGNRNSQYYIYKYEYGRSWEKYKLSEDEYINYVSDVETQFSADSIKELLTDKNRFCDLEDTKYNNFYYYNEPRYGD